MEVRYGPGQGSKNVEATIASELIIILGLILLNGVFSAAEIAVVSLRRSRLQQLLEEKRPAAKAVERLRAAPERFFATVQIGITVVGSTASAFGGAQLSGRLLPFVQGVTGLQPQDAEGIAIGLVVAGVSALTIVVGELVPKSLGLRYAEGYALVMAGPLLGLSWIARPAVWALTGASNLLLRPFGDSTTFTESLQSPEELRLIVEEATRKGALDQSAGKIAARALLFGEWTAGDLMVPRNHVAGLPIESTREDIRLLLQQRRHTRMPVYKDSLDQVTGYVSARDLAAQAWEAEAFKLESIVRPVYFVPRSVRATRLLQDMQERRQGLAIVVDEHGGVEGMVTIEDLLEELVGELLAEREPAEQIKKEPDGAVVVPGGMALRELNRALGSELPEGEAFSTVAGLCISLYGSIPAQGVVIDASGGVTLEIVKARPNLVATVRVRRKAV